MPGNANRMSITTEMPESIQPPRQAATIASTTPAIIESATTAAGPRIDVRAPASRRDSRSRPCPSNPSGCPLTGPT